MFNVMLAGQILAADYPETVSDVQQQITVTGSVIDDQNEPLPGVNVLIKGTTSGTATDADGKFTLAVSGEDAVLVFSFMGYVTQEIMVGNRRDLKINMAEDARQIDEVVVVGYGTQKKETLTGSVVSVQSTELVATKNTNVQNMLTGKLPGVRNIQKTSEPGVFSNQFDIRGLGSPLLIVDGVPRGDFERMDPNEIESISILKDAAAAIYGMQAANGVILITTKSGERGKAKIEYSGYYGIQVPIDRLKPVNARDRAMLYNERSMRNRADPSRPYDDTYFQQLENGEMPDTDWYSLVMRETAPQQQHNISLSGGGEKVDYFVNLGYTDQSSFWTTNSNTYERYNVRANINAQITNRLKAGVRLNMIMDETDRQRTESRQILGTLWRSLPTDPVYANDTEPYYYQSSTVENVLALIHPEVSGFYNGKKNIFQSNFQLDYDVPVDGLTTAFLFSFDRANDDNTTFVKEYAEYRYDAVTETYAARMRQSPTELTRAYNNSQSYLWNIRLNYDRTFAGVHHVGALLLYEERHGYSYGFNGFRQYEIPIPYLFAGISETARADGGGPSENAMKALVGRANYEYAGKYIAEFSFRYDGSSKFPEGSQWGFFPSVQLAYRISEESFLKDNLPVLNNLKIRATWGQLGHDESAAFQFIEGFDYPMSGGSTTTPRGYIFGNTFVNGLGFRNAPNPYLTWITATMKNIGVDADLWKGLYGFSVDFFQRDRDGLMATPATTIPATFGSGISQANLNADRVKGFELEMRHRNKVNSFNYSVTGFVQMTRNMWTKIHQTDRQNSYDYWRNNIVDRYNDIWFGYSTDGIYDSWEEIYSDPLADGGTLPGDPKYVDWNGDGRLNDEDQHPIATITSDDANRLPTSGDLAAARNYPLMNYGWTMSGQWKSLDFNILFQGAAMAYVGMGEQIRTPLMWDGNALSIHLDRWHPVDPAADPWDPDTEWVKGFFPYGQIRPNENSDATMQKANYLRLKSAEIGFTVPKNTVFDRIGVKHLRLYVNAYNLLTFTKVKGVDPERPSESNGQLYPLNRTFNFGCSLSF
jgi:TonB-linked SusC/RagA family outer membrane protein